MDMPVSLVAGIYTLRLLWKRRCRSRDDEKSKYTVKVKAKDKTGIEEDCSDDAVNLPNIPSPISTLSIFDLILPTNASSTGRGVKEEFFKSDSPIKVTDTSKNPKSINNFTFSKPINANDKDSLDDSNRLSKTLSVEPNASTLSTSLTSNFIWSNTSTALKLKEKFKEKDPSSGGGKGTNDSCATGRRVRKLVVEMWECSQCLVQNVKSDAHCVACKASKSIPKVKKTTENSSASSTVTITQSKPVIADCFGSQSKMSSNQWECKACLVRNKQTDIKCVSSTTPRPGSAKTPLNSSSSNVAGKSDLMEKFGPAKDSWKCPGCMVRNSGIVETCSSCNTSKPGSLKISPNKLPADSNSCNNKSAGIGFGEKPKSADDSWKCLNCKVKNSRQNLTCPCFKAAKSILKTTATSGFNDKFKKPEGAWTCDNCMLQNKGDISECIACGAAKPSSKKITKPTSNSSSGSNSQFNFSFPENAGGFKFGIDKSNAKIEANKPESSEIGFTIGVTETGRLTMSPPQNTIGCKFGVGAVNLPNIPLPISTLPTFDIMPPTNTSNTGKGVKEEFFKSVSPIKVTDTSENLKSINNFKFSKPINVNDRDSLDDSNTLSKTLSVETNASTPSTSSTPNFIWSNTSTAPKLKETFKEKDPFSGRGKGTNNLCATSGANSKPFSNPLFKGNENKPVPALAVAENKPQPLLGAAETKTQVFGVQDSKTIAFGNAGKTTAPFGNATPAFRVSTALPALGTAPTPGFETNSTPSMLAAANPAKNAPPTTNSGLLKFGGNTSQTNTPQSSSGFNFSGNNTAPTPAQTPVQKNLFDFGNNTSTQEPGPGFGNSTNFNKTTAPEAMPKSLALNSPKPDPPAFGQTASMPTSMFGAPQSTSWFGQNQATLAFGAAAPAPGSGFNIGGQAPTAAPGGGFTFNVPSPDPAIAFDQNTRLTYNFTVGSAPTAFNATPQAAPQRKFRKAVRRQ